MSEQHEQFLIVAVYKHKYRLFNAKPTWQILDAQQNYSVIIDDLKTVQDAHIEKERLLQKRNTNDDT